MFAKLVSYVFLLNQSHGNIPKHLCITSSKKQIAEKLGDNFVIYLGEATQQPDCDLVIYNEQNLKFIVLSLKTSMRERAEQTYIWKLLLEIAFSNDEQLKERFQLAYRGSGRPLLCLVMSNFYDEIANPQQRGMFRFFDASFITQPRVKHALVKSLSELPDFIQGKIC